MNHIIVIGGGIAGLSAAYYASRIPEVQVTLLESSDHWGGKITTDRVAFDDGQFIIEGGPDTFLATKPWGARASVAPRMINRNMNVMTASVTKPVCSE